jgi:hypothetical protein
MLCVSIKTSKCVFDPRVVVSTQSFRGAAKKYRTKSHVIFRANIF